MQQAKAAVFMGANKPFSVRSFAVLSAPSGYARMELIASGVCGTDIHFHNGKLAVAAPTVLGHEFVGRITDVDEKEAAAFGLRLGDNVIADIAVPCGECPLCRSGNDANCVRMRVTNGGAIDEAPYLWGGFAEVNFTPLSNLVKIPAGVDPATAAVFACPGPTVIHACRLAAKAGVEIGKTDTAVVQGLGPVGCFAVAYLKAAGVGRVYAITGKENPAREALVTALGAEKIFSLAKEGEEAIGKHLRSATDGLGVDLCFEASGVPEAIRQGMDLLRNCGTYLIPGQYSNSGGVEIQPQAITFKALHLIGSSQYSLCDVKDYLAFLVAHPELHDRIDALATRYPVAEIDRAFADAKARKNVKTLLVR